MKLLAVASLELRGALASAQGNHTEAIRLLQLAVDKERDMGYVEPPWYSRPAQEYLAAAYVSARQFDKAREAYDASLQLRPHNGFALYGIARSFELAGKASAAAKAYGDFQRAWAQADSDLPQIVHLTAWMTAHPGGTEWQSAKQSDHPHH